MRWPSSANALPFFRSAICDRLSLNVSVSLLAACVARVGLVVHQKVHREGAGRCEGARMAKSFVKRLAAAHSLVR